MKTPDIQYRASDLSILVDGAVWATVVRNYHGSRGQSYWFWQFGGRIIREIPTRGHKPHDMPPVSVPSQSRALEIERSSACDENRPLVPPKPLAERLVDTARGLIASGLLRDPRVVAEESTKRRRALEAARAAALASEVAELEHRARQAIQSALIKCGPTDSLPLEALVNALVPELVAAMQWAQSR